MNVATHEERLHIQFKFEGYSSGDDSFANEGAYVLPISRKTRAINAYRMFTNLLLTYTFMTMDI